MKSTVGIATNEVSRRYVDTTPKFFLPTTWSERPEKSIKQGAGVPHPEQEMVHSAVTTATESALKTYELLLLAGIAPEQARMVLPQNTMTSIVQTMSLFAASRLVKQRLGKGAQKEVGIVAEQLKTLAAFAAPISWEALMDAG